MCRARVNRWPVGSRRRSEAVFLSRTLLNKPVSNEHILQVGAWLGQEAKAREIVARFDADLAALAAKKPDGLRVALYGPNGYTTGTGTLADDILSAAGLQNIAADAGIPGGGTLPLERLVLLHPDILVSSNPYPGYSQAEAVLNHPAIRAIPTLKEDDRSDDASWGCETPHILNAVREMRALAERTEAQE